MIFLEVAVFNYESAVTAKKGGADRLEICENYAVGGLTPSYEYVQNVKNLGRMDVFVMIRQTTNSFEYSKKDIDKMLSDIELFKGMDVNGFVFGGLDKTKSVNKEYSKLIIEAANPIPVTFHRAFDLCKDLNKATEDVIECGFKRILTSGGKSNAYEGRFVIRDLIKRYGREIIFMPGGGIRKNNITEIKGITKATEYHTAALRENQNVVNPIIEFEDLIGIKS
jgi:copper homeostasis protein